MIGRLLASVALTCGLAASACAQVGTPAPSAGEEATLKVCFNYGCLAEAEVTFSAEQLAEVATLLRADTAAEERARLGEAIGRLYAFAGAKSPIAADKGGNLADDAVYGRMDCIDHSLTTTRFLTLLEARGMLRYHTVGERVLRSRFLLFQHYAAQIVEHEVAPRVQMDEAVNNPLQAVANDASPADGSHSTARFAVDSWFFDNGHPAVIMPLANWMSGEGPDVGW